MAKKHGLEFIESSAKSNYNVEPIFQKIAEKVFMKIENHEIDLTNEVFEYLLIIRNMVSN